MKSSRKEHGRLIYCCSSSDLRFRRPRRHSSMHIADPTYSRLRIPIQLIPQQTEYAHLRSRRNFSPFRDGDIEHLVRRRNRVDDAIF